MLPLPVHLQDNERKEKGDMEVTQHRTIRRYSSGKFTVYRVPIECFPDHSTNVYLIMGSSLALVDTGLENEKSRKDLAEGLRIIQSEFQEDLELEDISDIVITHGHIDHFGMIGHEAFAKKKVYIHEHDSDIIKNYDVRTGYSLKRIDSFLRTTGVSDVLREGIIDLYHSDMIQFKPRLSEHRVIDLHDNDEIIDGYRVYHTPGHAPGAVCLEVGDFLFTGDHLLSRITPVQSPGSIINGVGLRLYQDSLKKIARAFLQKESYGLPGHEEDIYPISDRVEEILRFHKERLDAIEMICREPESIYDITVAYVSSLQPEVFAQPDYPDFHKLLALFEIGAHVEYLEEEERLRRVDNKGDVIIYGVHK